MRFKTRSNRFARQLKDLSRILNELSLMESLSGSSSQSCLFHTT